MTNQTTLLYVSESEARRITVLALSLETGALENVQELPVDGKVMPLAITPDRRFLFASLRDEPYRIAQFAIDAEDGTLRLLGHAAAAESTVYINTDRTGRFLLSACNPSNRARRTGITTLSRIDDGVLKDPSVVLRTPPKLHSIIPDPSNRFAFAASCDGDMIIRYALDVAQGTLSADGLSPTLLLPRAGPRHMRFHPDGRSFYVVNEYDASIYVYSYDAARGTLSELQIVSALPKGYAGNNSEAADIRLTPDGRFLYASVRDQPILACFSVHAGTGMLTEAGQFETAREPRSFGIDPAGQYLVAAAMSSAMLVSYRIDQQTGGLTKVAEISTGAGPNWVEFLPLP